LSSLKPIGEPFIELLTVESTNNYAMGLVRAAMAQHGAVVFTHEQTRGKGQRNKEWVSQTGQNIAMSIVLEPDGLLSSEAFLLSMMAAVAVRELVSTYTTDNIKIKWPNDIYWRDRKAAGILIENVWQGNEWRCAVIGVGINVNQTEFGELSAKAASLKEIAGRELKPLQLAKQLCTIMEDQFQLLIANPSAIVESYTSYLYKRNQIVKLRKQNRVFEATIKDVNKNGELIVQHTVEERFTVGELEWV
jgi:BirA family biotin operon repressor/biotin-[acetyl-CoA-carboxylase] ligase